MKRIFLIISLLITLIYAKEIKQPIGSFISSGYVTDLVYKDSKLYSATDAGSVDIFDIESKKVIKQIKVDKIKDFMGDNVDSKVFSVDEMDGEIMILSQDKQGFSRLHIQKDDMNYKVIDHKDALSIIKAKYIDRSTVLLALLSNEIISFDLNSLKQKYRVQVSGGKFSDFALSEDKSKVVVADESGDIRIHDTKTGKNIKTIKGQNVDNLFQIAYKNSIIATAGQDRRVAIYAPNFNSSYYKQSDFLVYGVGLSPSGKIVAYSSDEQNNVSLFNTITKSPMGTFGGNKITISDIEFIDENRFLVSTNSKIINLYKIR